MGKHLSILMRNDLFIIKECEDEQTITEQLAYNLSLCPCSWPTVPHCLTWGAADVSHGPPGPQSETGLPGHKV